MKLDFAWKPNKPIYNAVEYSRLSPFDDYCSAIVFTR